MTNQFIVTIASKITNQQETTVAEADLAEAAVDDMVEIETVDAGAGGYGRNSRGGGGGYGRDRPPREMHKATCGDCGNECEVPFKPSGDKPVYCNDCFQDHKPARDDRGRGRY